MADKIVIGILRALLTADTAQFEGGMRQAQTTLRTFSKDAAAFGRVATSLGASMTIGLTAPILAFGAAVAKVSMDFESSFAGVRKTTEATETQFRDMAKGLRELSKQIPINVNELTHLAEIAGALGIPTEQVIEFTEVMAKLGKTTNVTSEEAANAIAKIQNIFAASGKDTERFASALVKLGNEGASTEAQILELANRAASAGRAIGLTQADVLGFAAAIANVGIEAEAGGSAISRTFNDITLAVSLGTKDLQAFARIAGMSVENFSTLFKTDARSAVMAFIGGLAQIGTQSEAMVKRLNEVKAAGGNVTEAIQQMVEADTDMARALKEAGIIEVRQLNLLRALALAYGTDQGLAKSIDFANQGWAEMKALAAAASARFATTASELIKLGSAFADIGITLGESLLPLIKAFTATIREMLPLLETMAKIFVALPVPVQALAVGFGLLVAGMGPALFIAGQLAFSVSQLALAFGKGGVAIKLVTGLMTGLRTAFVGVAAAARAAALSVGLFSAALFAIGVTAGMLLVQKWFEALEAHRQHQQDMINGQIELNQAAGVAGRNFAAMNVALLATGKSSEGLQAAKRNVDALTKAQEINRRAALATFAESAEGMAALEGRGKIAIAPFHKALSDVKVEMDATTGGLKILGLAVDKSAEAAHNAKFTFTTLTQELANARILLAKLEPAQRSEIAAGIEMGRTNEQIKETFDSIFPSVKITDVAIGLFRDQLQKAGVEARKAARDFAELTGAQERSEAFELALALQRGVLNLNEMTVDSQREVAATLIKGVESWLALGQAVPFSVGQQLTAVSKLRIIPDTLDDISNSMEGFKDSQRDIFKQFVDRQRELAADTSSAILKSINDRTAAERDAAQIAAEIEFNRAEHTIKMAEQAGARWEDLYAMERALHRARVDFDIFLENRRFAEETKLLDRSIDYQDAQYKAMEAQHNARIQSMNEQFLLSEQQKWDALRRTKQTWFVALEDMKRQAKAFVDETTSNLLSILTGLGHDIDGELAREEAEAKEHYEKVKRAGKSSAEAISNAFQRYREAQDRANFTFLERMREVWLSFKRLVIGILNDILGYFVRSFIGGMIKAMVGANLGQQFGNLLTGAGPGGIGSALAQTAGGAAITAAGGVATASLPGLTAAGAAAGGLGAFGIPGGLAMGMPAPAGAAAGTPFFMNPAFWTNPWTIGIGVGAALLTVGIKKGLFRGGEEALKVNPRRDQFILQFGPPGTNPGSGFAKLAARLSEWTGVDGGGPMFRALNSADTVREFEAAQAQIVRIFRQHRMAVRSFEMGGFVPPGAIVPAVLHGGLYGEDITPRDADTERTPGRVINLTHNIRIEGMIDREGAEAFYRDYVLPAEKRALQLNTQDILTVHRRVLVP